MNKTLIMLVGLPRSGKSTYRKKLVEQFKYLTVCPDTLRLLIHGEAFKAEYEKQVWQTAELMVKAAFEDGQDVVILDATSITKKDRNKWKSDKWRRDIRYIDTPMDVCLSRIEPGKNEYLKEVIERMNKNFQFPTVDELQEGESCTILNYEKLTM